MKDTRDLEQVLRIDGQGCFAEVMLSGIHFDKTNINFVAYNKAAEPGKRSKGSVSIFMDMYEALVLSNDIMSGRIPTLGKIERRDAAKEGRKYANAVYTKQGGTSSKRTKGDPIARQFEITPGARQPWILCAKQGKGRETPEGLIVMDGMPEVTIRVPMSDQKLKEFALAIGTVFRVWEQLRFVPIAAPAMNVAIQQRKEAIDRAKSAASAT